MDKTVKIISTLLIAVVLMAVLSNVCLATDYGDIISQVDQAGQGPADNIEGVKTVAGNVIKIIRNAAAIGAVVIISILGIKYMIGSTEERAEYKKSFIPLIVGIVVVLAAAQIAQLIFSMGG